MRRRRRWSGTPRPLPVLASACAHEISGVAAEVFVGRKRARDWRVDLAKAPEAGRPVKHPLHECAHTRTPVMAGAAHQIVAQRSALNACVVADAGGDPGLSLIPRALSAGLARRGCARERDIARAAHRREVGASVDRVIAVKKTHGHKAEAALDGVSFPLVALIKLRSHDRMSRMAGLDSLLKIRVAWSPA